MNWKIVFFLILFLNFPNLCFCEENKIHIDFQEPFMVSNSQYRKFKIELFERFEKSSFFSIVLDKHKNYKEYWLIKIFNEKDIFIYSICVKDRYSDLHLISGILNFDVDFFYELCINLINVSSTALENNRKDFLELKQYVEEKMEEYRQKNIELSSKLFLAENKPWYIKLFESIGLIKKKENEIGGEFCRIKDTKI